jgi:hypothetical protein
MDPVRVLVVRDMRTGSGDVLFSTVIPILASDQSDWQETLVGKAIMKMRFEISGPMMPEVDEFRIHVQEGETAPWKPSNLDRVTSRFNESCVSCDGDDHVDTWKISVSLPTELRSPLGGSNRDSSAGRNSTGGSALSGMPRTLPAVASTQPAIFRAMCSKADVTRLIRTITLQKCVSGKWWNEQEEVNKSDTIATISHIFENARHAGDAVPIPEMHKLREWSYIAWVRVIKGNLKVVCCYTMPAKCTSS